MAANEIISERRGASLIVTFNRPDHSNALTLDMANQLFTVLKNVTTDPGVRAVLLRGAGGNFMDGRDISMYGSDINAILEASNQMILPYHSSIRELQTMEKPVISLVQGRVTGAGFSFMLASDFVLASPKTTFNAGFAKEGLAPNGGCSHFLPRKVGLSVALEIMMLSEDFDADYAQRHMLVNRILDDATLDEQAIIWLDKLAQGPTKAYGSTKKLAQLAFAQDIRAQLGLEHTLGGQCARSFDFRESVRAIVAKREVKFTGT